MDDHTTKNWISTRVEKIVSRAVQFLMFAAIAITLFGFLVKALWNWLMPPLFGFHLITFEQALGLLALSWILFGVFRGRPGHHWRRRFMDRWEQMTPEERERLRRGVQA
jgi:Ca2+/H+ antiporter, TMEM165/GDT1 family